MKLDDSLDVFGIHGLGGITGSIGTAVVALPLLGGHGGLGYAFGHQLLVQLAAVAIAIVWSAAGSGLCFRSRKVIDAAAPSARRRARGSGHQRSWRARIQLLSGQQEGARRRLSHWPLGAGLEPATFSL